MKRPLDLPPHPTRRTAIVFIVAGVALFAWIALFLDLTWMSAILELACVFCAGIGVRLLRDGRTAQLLNLAIDRRTRGHLDESDELLHAIPKWGRRAHLRRAMELQLALNAHLRDDPRSAVLHASSAIDGRRGYFTGDAEQVQIDHARGVRAVAAAELDDATTVMADVAAAHRSPLVTPDSLARVAVAEAILLSRRSEHDKLRALLARDRRLLLEFTTPRDRALVRSLQRMLCAPAGSAYRVAAPRVESRDESELGSWLARVAPEAAAFAPTGGSIATSAASARLGPDATAIGRKPLPKGRGIGRPVLLLWVVLVVCFLGIWQFLAPRPTAPPLPAPGADPATVPFVAIAVVFVALVAGLTIVNRRSSRKLTEAMCLLGLPDLAAATTTFTAMAKSRLPVVAGQAHLQLAGLSARRAAFADALAHCETGLARVAGNLVAAQYLRPQLLARRAFALAALGKDSEASAELSALATEHPTYGLMASTQLAVRMMQAVKRGDLDAARGVAKQRTLDMPFDVKIEALADTLTATGAERVAPSEIERLRGELASDAELRGWMKDVWADAGRELERAAERWGARAVEEIGGTEEGPANGADRAVMIART